MKLPKKSCIPYSFHTPTCRRPQNQMYSIHRFSLFIPRKVKPKANTYFRPKKYMLLYVFPEHTDTKYIH